MKYALILFMFPLPLPSFAAMHTDSITEDGTVCFSPSIKTAPNTWEATIRAYGTWGSGTISWITRTGTSSVTPLFDKTHVAKTSSADDQFKIDLGKAAPSGTDLKVCATMAGSTNPSITIELYDNN